MSSFSARIIVDEVTPWATNFKAQLTGGMGKVLKAVGEEVVSITQKAFVNAGLRASIWPPKRDGSPATLIKSGLLRESIRIVATEQNRVIVGSDRVYAAVQQLGSREYQPGASVDLKSKRVLLFKGETGTIYARRQNIPPRPFFPVDAQGNFTETATEQIRAVIEQAIGAYMPGS